MSTEQYQKETAKVHKHFDIGVTETVVTHFACAHKGRMLKQGRLYITQNYLCFYAVIVGKVHKKTIKLVDVADVTKTNYGVFPNAIKVTTRKKKEVVFASFLMRDQAFDAIRKEWLNLMGEDYVPEKEETEKRGASPSPSPRRGSVEPSSGSESEKEKKKRRWSLSKKEKKEKKEKKNSADLSDQSAYSDTDIGGSDVSSGDAQRRHSTSGAVRRASTSSTSSNERNSGKFSSPNALTSSAPISNSRPSSTSLSQSTSSTQGSSSRPSSTSLSPSSASPTKSPSAPSTPSSSRSDRAQALISSGAITVEPETSATQANRQSANYEVADPTNPATEPLPLPMWRRLCNCF